MKIIIIVSLIMIILSASTYSFGAGISTTMTQIQEQIITLNQQVCSSFKANSETWNIVNSTCLLTGMKTTSPIFVTNFTTELIIPNGMSLTLSNGLGFASYGQIENIGTITIESPFVNYGIVFSTSQIVINNVVVNLNDSDSSSSSTGIFTNSDLTPMLITQNGYFDNGNTLIDNAGIVNNGVIDNYVSGLNFTATITGGGIIQGNQPVPNPVSQQVG
jgi:hypothetical protein